MEQGNSLFIRAFIRSPMLRTALPFIMGLIAGRVLLFSWEQGWVALILVFAAWSFLHFKKLRYALRWLRGALFIAFWLVFGALWQSLRQEYRHPAYLAGTIERVDAWQVEVTAPPVDNGRSIRVWAVGRAARDEGIWRPVKGGLLMTLLSDSLRPAPEQGDVLLVRGRAEAIAREPSPGGFDVRQWAAGRGVHHQVFVPKENWARLNPVPIDPGFFTGMRDRLSLWLYHSGLPDRERALVKALVLGQRDELQSDQTEAFVRSGTIHVLAVSGTHVGIIYGVLLLAFFWISRFRHGKVWRGLFVLVGLWGYAGLTGFAPSVLRATVMFSLFTIAQMTRWRVESLNSLAAAALLLLLWDPAMLGQLSFQLSFLAVLGIIVFYDPIQRLWDAPNQVLHYLWSIAAVSLAAQAFTAPLCLYVFRAFPVWFLPANMAIGGLIVVALWGGLILMVFHAVPVLGAFLSVLMRWLLFLLGSLNDFFAWLPGAYPAFRVGVWGMLGLYALLAFAAFWFIQRSRWAPHATLATLAALLFAWGWTAHQRNAQRGFTAYAQREGFACAFVEGRTLHLFGTQMDAWSERTVKDHVRHAGIERVVRTDALPERVRHGTDDYVFLSGKAKGRRLPEEKRRTVLLVTDGLAKGDSEIDSLSGPTEWVLGAGLRPADRRRVHHHAEERGEHCHDLRSRGAYVRQP